MTGTTLFGSNGKRNVYGYNDDEVDEADRYNHATSGGTLADDWTYSFDGIGNRLSAVGPDTGNGANISYTYTPGSANEYTQIKRGANYRYLTRKYDTAIGTKGRDKGFKLGWTGSLAGDMEASYGYDSYGRFDRVWIGAQSGMADFSYDFVTNSNLVDEMDGPSIDREYVYETNRDLVTYVKNLDGATNRSTYRYSYDDNRRRSWQKGYGYAFTNKSKQHDYIYNDRGEVTQDKIRRGSSSTDTTPTNTTEATLDFVFDSIGNRDYIKVDGGSAQQYTTANTNRYTVAPGESPAPAHDDDGNLTSMGGNHLHLGPGTEAIGGR